jgi:hypothetical protein
MFLIIYIVVLIIIIYLIIKYFSNVVCGGRIDPTLRYCNEQSKLVTGKKIPEDECNPINNVNYDIAFSQFLAYMRNIIQNSKTDLYQQMIQHGFNNISIGSFYFAIPPLLKLLDSDFGQNKVAPYGIISFPDIYIDNCISDTNIICDRLRYPKLCRLFFKQRQQTSNGKCPFDVSDKSTDTYIEDVGFFNTLGILGTFSLNIRQLVVMYYDLPVANLDLNYWSFNVYLADRIKKGQTCSPMRQTYLASIIQPMNCFMTPAISGKKFNPLTGQGDVIQEGHIRMYIIIGIDSIRLDNMKTYLQTLNNSDVIHIFQLPTTMTLDPTIANPNHLVANDKMYDPKTDRLSVFLRLSPSPNTTFVQDYITNQAPFAQVLLIEDDSIENNTNNISSYTDPLYIAPIFNEIQDMSTSFQKLVQIFKKSVPYTSVISTRNTILNIFAPLYPGLLATTTRKYKGGYQAIQLAGIGQGDNSDTQYRLSKGICLGDDDVMVSISVNHARYGNCIYNNINIIDLNKAYSLASITLDQQMPYDVYIVLTGRNMDRISEVHGQIAGKFTETGLQVLVHDIFIPTRSSIDDGIPKCHQILMAERVYVNRQYTNQEKNKLFLLDDLFGNDMKGLMNTNKTDAWNNLLNVTAPDVDTLIPPLYLKISKNNPYTIWIIVICLLLLAIIAYCCKSWKSL